MKKIIAILIMVSVLLTGTAVFAEDGAVNTGSRAELKAKINEFKDFKAELKPLIDTVKSNREEFVKLRQESTSSYKSMKDTIKHLLKGKDKLTQVQIEKLKNGIDIIVADKKLLAGTKGEIFKESVDLKIAKQARDIEACKEALNNIINTQNQRIDALKKIIEDINAIEVI